MAFPKLFRKLFAGEGAGPKLRQDILPDIPAGLLPDIPAELLPLATPTAKGAVPALGGPDQFLKMNKAGSGLEFGNLDLTPYASTEQLSNHAALTSTHGATAIAAPDRILLRDSAGRTQVTAGAAAADAVNLAQMQAAINAAGNRVVEAWSSGTSWYRKWSDGWLEQGGYSPGGSGVTVSLPMPFSNTNYTVVALTYRNGTADSAPTFNNKTTGSFLLARGSGSIGVYWAAMGC